MIVRNSRYKQVLPDTIAYKGQKYTKAYAKGKLLFANTDDDYEYQYMTVESLEDGNVITFTKPATITTSDLTSMSYSTDGGATWTTLTNDGSTAQSLSVSLDAGDKAIWKGTARRLNNNYGQQHGCHFTSTAEKQWVLSGNIMSLLYGDDFYGKGFPGGANNMTFYGLFCTMTTTDYYLVDASNFVLPAKTLKTHCYAMMFKNNTGLVHAPKVLPAEVATTVCYYHMFYNCTSLEDAPYIAATSLLGQQNFYEMFRNCAKITHFQDELFPTTLTNGCYSLMFYGCSGLEKAPKLPATTLTDTCYRYMFTGCTSLTDAPELPAATLVNQCYQYMFQNCTSLNYIKCLATDISATNCTTQWVRNVASTGTFVKADGMNNWLIDSIDGIPIGWTIHEYEIDYEQEYFTTLSQEDSNVITFTIGSGVTTSNFTSIAYSTDNGTNWTTLTNDGSTEQTLSVTLNKGQKAIWKGTGVRTGVVDNVIADRCTIMGSKTMNVYGNITSLLKGDNFYNNYSMSQAGTYVGLFYKDASNDANIVDASKLVLPATTLSASCYYEMFRHCQKLLYAPKLPATTLPSSPYRGMFRDCLVLKEAPELPATTLGTWCYTHMFYNCKALTEAPELPSTTINQNVYYGMFYSCTSLVNAPELPAPTLYNQCYREMFNGCSSLNYIKCLATNISATDCTKDWVKNVASSGTFVKADNMTSWLIDSVNGIPIGWTPHVDNDYTSQYFTIESLEDNCSIIVQHKDVANDMTFYYSLDNGSIWTSYSYVGAGNKNLLLHLNAGDKALFKATCTKFNWKFAPNNKTKKHKVYGNAMSLVYGDNFQNQTTFPANTQDEVLASLFSNNEHLVSAKDLVLPATTLTGWCYASMFYGCDNLVDIPELPATTLASGCYRLMFMLCQSLVTPPALPATTLAPSCYYGMFNYCMSMTTAPALPATILADSCYSYMFQNCSKLAHMPSLPATTLAKSCYKNMFAGCKKLTDNVALYATTLAENCYYYMFANANIERLSVYAISSSWSINFGEPATTINPPVTGVYFVKPNATSNILNACPTGWTISKTL